MPQQHIMKLVILMRVFPAFVKNCYVFIYIYIYKVGENVSKYEFYEFSLLKEEISRR